MFPIGPGPYSPYTLSHDSYFSSVQLLLHGDGANNGTVFTDSSHNNFAATRGGSAVTSTTQVKYGTASLKLNGTTDYLSYADNAVWTVGSSDFTIECWVYLNSVTGQQEIIADYSDNSRAWVVGVEGTELLFIASGATVGSGVNDTIGAAMSTGAWIYLAYVRDGSTLRVYKNGAQVGSATISGSVTDSTSLVYVGCINTGTVASPTLSFFLNGYIDDLRVTNGVCRYPGGTTFTPPTKAFPNF